MDRHETNERQGAARRRPAVAAGPQRGAPRGYSQPAQPARMSPDMLAELAGQVPNSALARMADLQRYPPGEGGTGIPETFPINLNRRITLGGDYAAQIDLQAELRWSPFGIQVVGDDNALVIMDGEDERGRLEFGTGGEFQAIAFDTDAVSARFGEDGFEEGSVEVGPVSAEYSDRTVSLTFDVLGLILRGGIQEAVEDVAEVSSEFVLEFEFPTGEDPVRLSDIGMDFSGEIGPEQARLLAEMSIHTTQPGDELEMTTASGSISLHINIFGIERDIDLFESEAAVGSLGMRHESDMAQVALRAAFRQAFDALGDASERPTLPARLRFLQTRFNQTYTEAYNATRQRIIDHYLEEHEDLDEETLSITDNSSREALTLYPGGMVTVDPFCRNIIIGSIQPSPAPLSLAQFLTIWEHVITRRQPGEQAAEQEAAERGGYNLE